MQYFSSKCTVNAAVGSKYCAGVFCCVVFLLSRRRCGSASARFVGCLDSGKQRMMGETFPTPSCLIQQTCSPLVCRLHPPHRHPSHPPDSHSGSSCFELLITSLSPLCCIPCSFVILPRKQIRKPSLFPRPQLCSFFFSFFPFPPLSRPRPPSTLPARGLSPTVSARLTLTQPPPPLAPLLRRPLPTPPPARRDVTAGAEAVGKW